MCSVHVNVLLLLLLLAFFPFFFSLSYSRHQNQAKEISVNGVTVKNMINFFCFFSFHSPLMPLTLRVTLLLLLLFFAPEADACTCVYGAGLLPSFPIRRRVSCPLIDHLLGCVARVSQYYATHEWCAQTLSSSSSMSRVMSMR